MSHIDQKTATEVYRAYMQHQLETANEMGGLALECIGKLSALNMKIIANSIAESSQISQQSLGARNPTDLAESAAAQLPVRAQENVALSRDYLEALATMNAGFIHAAQQHAIRLNKQITEALQKQTRLGDSPSVDLGAAWTSGTTDIPAMIFQMVEAGRRMSDTWNDNMRSSQAQVTSAASDAGAPKEKPTSRHAKS